MTLIPLYQKNPLYSFEVETHSAPLFYEKSKKRTPAFQQTLFTDIYMEPLLLLFTHLYISEHRIQNHGNPSETLQAEHSLFPVFE